MAASTPDAEQEAAQLAAARLGDPGAIEALLDRHQQRVFGFGLRMCGDEEDARDVLQDTLLAAARTVRDFRGASSVSTWLYAIARSFCLKKRRRSKYAPTAEVPLDAEADHLASDAAAPDEAAAREEIRRALAATLESLEPASREVIILRDMEGLTAPEVAEVLGTSVEAVKSRLHRARVAVRERLARVLDGDERARGPDCPDVLTAYSKKLEGDIDSRLCTEMEEHLRRCTGCRAACGSLQQALALCSSSPAGRVSEPVRASVRSALRAVLAGDRA